MLLVCERLTGSCEVQYGRLAAPQHTNRVAAQQMTTLAFRVPATTRRRLAAAIVLGCLAVGAWAASVDRMDAMGMEGRFSVGSLGFFVALWVLMMAAMMFPSVWPAVAVYGLVARQRVAAHPWGGVRSSAFVAGYLGAWTAFGLVAFALLGLARSAGLDTFSNDALARSTVAPVALAAALYELAPFKQACLRHCRGPLSFFLEHWRDGARGAVEMGARHGAYCVGCCWMLMFVLLAVGLMSITWMAVVSLAIAVEKLAPARWTRLANVVLIVGLVAVAVIALVKPSWLPGVGADMGSGGGDEMTNSIGIGGEHGLAIGG